jgi:hypothetical protein
MRANSTAYIPSEEASTSRKLSPEEARIDKLAFSDNFSSSYQEG